MKPKLSSKKYVKQERSQCPICLSTDIDGGPIDIDTPYARQEITCCECGASWVDVYKLHHYFDLQEA